jgi:hypothetical protein
MREREILEHAAHGVTLQAGAAWREGKLSRRGGILLEARHVPGPRCIADERRLPGPLTERMAHAIQDPAVRAREPRGAHAPRNISVLRELPGARPDVHGPKPIGDETGEGLLDRGLRLRRGFSAVGAEQKYAHGRPGEHSRRLAPSAALVSSCRA